MKTLPLAVPHMNEAEAEEVFGWILDGEASEEEIARFLLAGWDVAVHDQVHALQNAISIGHLQTQHGRFDVNTPLSGRVAQVPLQLFTVDAAEPVIPIQLADQTTERDGSIGKTVRLGIADLDLVVVAG